MIVFAALPDDFCPRLMISRLRHLIALLAAVGCVLAFASNALASSQDVIQDCADDGALSGDYSKSELSGALNNIPSDLNDYSDCHAIIAGALAKRAGGGSGGGANATAGGSGGPAAAAQRRENRERAKERAERRRHHASANGSTPIDGLSGRPGGTGAITASDTTNGLPTSLLLAAIALSGLAVAGGIVMLRRRNPAFADALRRVRVPGLRR